MATSFFATRLEGPAFCPECSTILTLAETNSIVCNSCGYACKYQDLENLQNTSHSRSENVPAWQTDAKTQDKKASGPARATVDEPCPKCGHGEMEFYTMQLRSADEGQTVFYECTKCKHKFSVNT